MKAPEFWERKKPLWLITVEYKQIVGGLNLVHKLLVRKLCFKAQLKSHFLEASLITVQPSVVFKLCLPISFKDLQP